MVVASELLSIRLSRIMQSKANLKIGKSSINLDASTHNGKEMTIFERSVSLVILMTWGGDYNE